MNNVKSLVREINKGKNLSENLPMYRDRLFDIYNEDSLLHITMEYYVLYETLQEEAGKNNWDMDEVLEKIEQVISRVFINDECSADTKEEILSVISECRKEVIKKMKLLTMYTDRLALYEHVVNRMELKFQKDYPVSDVDTFVRKVCQFIFSGEDNAIVNERIREILGELPVRMARSKYFQLIEDSMSVYVGSEKASVERFVYMLESSAMLYEAEEVEGYLTELSEFSEKICSEKVSDMSEAEFKELCKDLEYYSEYISAVSDAYVGIQSLLNSLYCFVASKQKQEYASESNKACLEIVKDIYDVWEEGNFNPVSEETSNKLTATEGRQEALVEEMMQMETVLSNIAMGHEKELFDFGINKDFQRLLVLQQLVSSAGTFVDFEEEQNVEIADEAYITSETNKLIEKLKERFANNEISVTRAIIASTLSKFPVFFTSSNEVESYIQDTLGRCSDVAERQASICLIESVMNGEV